LTSTNKSEKLEQVNEELEDPAVWNDPKRAQDLGKEKKALEAVVFRHQGRCRPARHGDLFDMAREEGDDDTLEAIEHDAGSPQGHRRHGIPPDVQQSDGPEQLLHRHPGRAGGTEAQDWASMLLRQYLRYCERKGFKVECWRVRRRGGRHQDATIKVEGDTPTASCARKPACTAWCASRRSTRRRPPHLVHVAVRVPGSGRLDRDRVNPADAHRYLPRVGRRWSAHQQDRLRRASDPRPTGIVVQCQNDRSQHRNKAEAMEMLKAKLYELNCASA
jgi:peptide chain release factor 2